MKVNCIVLASIFTFLVSLAGVVGATHYVDGNSATPVAPYGSWATAATVIQDAVEVAAPGDEVVVTNGVYAAGGKAVYATMTNRVAVTKPLYLHSVNGPRYTAIEGRQVPGTTNGDGAIRCVYLTNGASLSGFTLTNGATRTTGDQQAGGGVFCEAGGVVSNCTIVANASAFFGGGIYSGTVYNSTISSNSATLGGGAAYAALENCVLLGNRAFGGSGAGANGGTLNNCIVDANVSQYEGGGVSGVDARNCLITRNSAGQVGASYGYGKGGGAYGNSFLVNCVLSGNSAADRGGGACICNLYNCTVVSNSASAGGGVYGPTNWYYNSIIYFNMASDGPNYGALPSLFYCCTVPLSGGIGNISSDPLFVDLLSGNFRLQANSPCINAGNNNLYVTTATDLDGNPRIVGGTVDIGAYEFVGPPIPSLRIARAGQNIQIFWPLWASSYELQEATSLGGGWIKNSGTPSSVGGEYVLTIPVEGAAKFYRLHLP